MKCVVLSIILYALVSVQVSAQELTFKDKSLAVALAAIRDAQTEYSVHFIHNDLEHLRVSARIKNLSTKDAIVKLCKKQPVKVKVRGKNIIVQYKPEKDFTGKTLNLSGSVEDGFLEMALPKVKVSVLKADSSIVVDSAQINILYSPGKRTSVSIFGAEVSASEREYIIRAQLDGYEDAWRRVTITNPSEENIYIDPLKMRKSTAKTLREVTISATKIKMFYKGDTIVYDATAFRMPEGSMLDDLIRQLPGVTLNSDGEIFVNGRKVDELLLGSRSFFGGNKKVLMENLPYYTVKNLKVYEKQTDKSMALGYDVEPRRYVMDVNLKDEYSQGYIGNVEAAGGTEKKWLSRGFLLGFTDKLRFTLLANANNVNESRHIGQSNHWSPARQPRSLLTTRSVAGEINYHSKGDKVKETFRAEYTSTTDEQTMTQRHECFIEGISPMSLTESFNHTGTKKLTLNNTLTLMKPFYLYAVAEFDFARRDGSFNSTFDEWNDSLTVSQRTIGISEGHVLNASLEAQGGIGVGRGKQALNFYAKVQHHKDESERANKYQTKGYASNLQYNTNDIFYCTNWGVANIGYNKEIAKDIHLGFTNAFFIRNQHNHDYLYHPDTLLLPSQIDALAAITDPSNSYDSQDREWSNNLTVRLNRVAQYRHPDMNIPIDYDRWALQIDMPVQNERLHYQRGALDTLARQTVLLPNFHTYYRYVWKGGRRDFRGGIYFSQTRVNLLDRIIFRDDSQPLVVKLGNPDLKPMMKTRFNLQYSDRAGRKKGMYSLSASFDYHHSDIAQSVSYNPITGVYTYKPMNVSGAYVAHADFSTDQNIGEKHYWSWHADAGADWNHSKDHAMMEGETESSENVVNTLTLKNGGHIRYNYKTLNVRAHSSFNWRHSDGKMYDFLTLNAFDFSYGFEASYTTPALFGTKVGGLTIAADGCMYSRRGYGSAPLNSDDFILNASLSQPFAKGKFILRLEGFDLLHQLSATQYVVNAQGRTETRYHSLPHYLMLHAVWHFNKNPKKQ